MGIPAGPWYIDDLLTFTSITHRFDTGAVTDADSVPSYRVYEDETGTAILNGSMAKLDDTNTTGFYSEQLTLSAANGFEAGKSYSIYVSAAVNSVTGAETFNFKVILSTYTANVTQIGGSNVTSASGIPEVKVASIAANAINAAAIASDAITDAKVASDVTIASVTGAVGSVTGNVGGNVAGSVASVTAAVTLTSGERNSVADALLDRDMSTGTDSGSTTVRTVRQALRFLRNKWSISGTTLTVCKEDDSTTSWTSQVTATAGADPITANDPAGP